MKDQEIHQLVDEHQEVSPAPPPHTVGVRPFHQEYDPPIKRTALPSEVNLPHAIDFRALCGANLVTARSNF